MIGTAFWYLATDQWRYDGLPADALASPLAAGAFAGRTTADCLVESVEAGLDAELPDVLAQPARPVSTRREAAGKEPAQHVVDALREGRSTTPCEDPDAPDELPARRDGVARQHPRLVRQGQRVLPEAPARHRLGRPRRGDAGGIAARATSSWRDDAPARQARPARDGDFRMTSTTLFCDLVLPAATWYEKHDLSSTDMHPFVHSFNPAISPPWQTKHGLRHVRRRSRRRSRRLSRRAPRRAARTSSPSPLQHDTPDEMAYAARRRAGRSADLVPGVTMAKLIVVERDYPALADRLDVARPAHREARHDRRRACTYHARRGDPASSERLNGVVADGPTAGRPRLRPRQARVRD